METLSNPDNYSFSIIIKLALLHRAFLETINYIKLFRKFRENEKETVHAATI